jgi:nucleoside-diphosphate-sugar epimerase
VTRKDIRDLVLEDLVGFDAIIHLAALSNDPLGELNPELTYEINHRASVRLAKLAREAGVERFLFSSSCSVYGFAEPGELVTEESPLHPLTPYASSKIRTEQELASLASDHFSPVFLRNATAYGWSAHFRADLVLNNLAAWAHTTGEIHILSDGTPWRPLIHVQDIASAFAAALDAPREAIHNQAFNVGVAGENYQVRDLALAIQETFPGCEVRYAGQGGPDPRSYRVDFSKISTMLPGFTADWNIRKGARDLRDAFQQIRLAKEDFTGPRYTRLARVNELVRAGLLDDQLRWKNGVTVF